MIKLKNEYITLSPINRLYESPLPIVALTGGIASGKTEVARRFQAKNIHVICADKLIKDIYSLPETIEFITALSPTCIITQKTTSMIDFPKLRELFFKDKNIKNKIETFLYNRLPVQFNKNLPHTTNSNNSNFIVYDIPLLFEKNLNENVDCIICVYTSRQMQKSRLLERDNISPTLAELILDAQLDIEEKKLKSHIIIDNNNAISHLDEEINKAFRILFD